ncbi:MAG: hypothetical protein GIW99_09700 [Candidatus Eremiobacteraeota bacterium]|nr:hypothetical protein [Candidatus Eremiobacteraeota bacterium]
MGKVTQAKIGRQSSAGSVAKKPTAKETIRKSSPQGSAGTDAVDRAEGNDGAGDSSPASLLGAAQDKRLAAELTKAIFECYHGGLEKKNAAEMGEMVSQVYFRCLRAVREER